MSEEDGPDGPDGPANFTVCREPGGKWGVRVGSTREDKWALEHLTKENLRWVDAHVRANELNAAQKPAPNDGEKAAKAIRGWFRSMMPKMAGATPHHMARLPEAITAALELRRVMDNLSKGGDPGPERMDELKAELTPLIEAANHALRYVPDMSLSGATSGIPEVQGGMTRCHKCGENTSVMGSVLTEAGEGEVLLFAWHIQCWEALASETPSTPEYKAMFREIPVEEWERTLSILSVMSL